MVEATIKEKYRVLAPLLDEQACRRWAATEAIAIGWGGVSLVARATGISRTTITAALREIADIGDEHPPRSRDRKLRRPGGGRKQLTANDPGLQPALERLVSPVTRGHPESPLLWTSKSTRRLAAELGRQGHRVSPRAVAKLLRSMDYSLQANSKVREGSRHADRDAQFEYINKHILQFAEENQPVISVDTKKKELIGSYYNKGVEWRPKASPEQVNDHDFPDPRKGKAIPYGVYDVNANCGWVSVGVDHDTPEFAVNSIGMWWESMGKERYPNATKVLVVADGGGSNGYRPRAWKTNLQRLANNCGLHIDVCHLPPGTSKWNKIEHRMFCHITKNWRGRPLVSLETVVSLIASTTTTKGLRIDAAIDTATYPTGQKVDDEELSRVQLQQSDFHGEWNYSISPVTI